MVLLLIVLLLNCEKFCENDKVKKVSLNCDLARILHGTILLVVCDIACWILHVGGDSFVTSKCTLVTKKLKAFVEQGFSFSHAVLYCPSSMYNNSSIAI